MKLSFVEPEAKAVRCKPRGFCVTQVRCLSFHTNLSSRAATNDRHYLIVSSGIFTMRIKSGTIAAVISHATGGFL